MSAIDKVVARTGDKDYAIRLITESDDDSLIIVLARDPKREELAMSVIGGRDFYTSDLLGLLAYGTACASRKFGDSDD